MMNWLAGLSEAAVEAVPAAAEQVKSFADMPVFTRGLVTTGMGLLGVFLVLGLFFVTIKLMQRFKDKGSAE